MIFSSHTVKDMEYALAGSHSDTLIDQLSFSVPPSQNYVIQRRNARFLPTGATSGFSAKGVNQVRITFTGTGWLDLSTLRIQATAKGSSANDAVTMQLYAGPALWADRIRVSAQGTVLEDCHYYNRIHEMVVRLQSSAFGEDERSEGFCKASATGTVTSYGKLSTLADGITGQFVPRGLGIVRQGKFWPMSYAPLTLEIWMAQDADWIKDIHGQTCVINNVCAHCDVVTLDSSLEESWSRYLLSGKVLTYATTQFITQFATVPGDGGDVTVSIVRALTRIRAMFVFFTRTDQTDPQQFECPDTRLANQMATQYFADSNMTAQVSIGSRLFPDSPMDNWTHMYTQLKQAVGQLDSTLKTMFGMNSFCGGTDSQFKSFILGFPFQRCDGYAGGISSRSGDLMTVRLRNVPSAAVLGAQLAGINVGAISTKAVSGAYLTLFADVLVQVGEGAVVVLD